MPGGKPVCMEALLLAMAKAATELLEADRASIFCGTNRTNRLSPDQRWG